VRVKAGHTSLLRTSMVLTETEICEFGWKAPDFNLVGTDGERHGLRDIRGVNGTLVMFICNHCPYVKGVIDLIVQDARELQKLGIGVIAIMPNDIKEYPQDGLGPMTALALEKGFSFPFVLDDLQLVARSYNAVCTPDFFGFNANLELQYRGRIAEVRDAKVVPGGKRDLFEAMTTIASTGQGPSHQVGGMGCSIKWRDGH